MAENEDGAEKSEEPTGKRIDDARKKGQIPRSKELGTMSLTMLGVVSIVMMGDMLANGFWEIFRNNFVLTRADFFDSREVIRHLKDAFFSAFLLLLPFFTAMVVIAIAASIALGGFNISGEQMKPKLSKFSLIKGAKRMVGLNGLVELLKAVAKVILIGGTTIFLLSIYVEDFINLSQLNVNAAARDMLEMVGWFTLIVCSTLIVLALIDVPYQLWKNKKDLKMTKQEVKDETKNTEGNPEIKRRVRQVQYEMSQRRMMEEVPKADVVITNPVHFAVALRYDQEEMAAPIVVAKGADQVAFKIRHIGEDNNITVIESPMLARAIYFTTELNHPIPAGLYLAVAKLLAYVYQLQASPFEIRDDAAMQQEWQVPDDYRFDSTGRKRPQPSTDVGN